jgi:lipoprotein-releasing system permease protein
LGVTLGISMFIALGGLMTGLNQFTRELSMTSTPDIRIYNDIVFDRLSILDEQQPDGLHVVHHPKPKEIKRNLKNAFEIVRILNEDTRIKGASPQLTSQVFYNYGPVDLNGSIVGVNILEEDKLFDIRSKIISGNMEELISTRDGLIMGSGLAKKLHVRPGDRIAISTPEGFTMKLKVVAIFQMGLGAIDNIRSYSNIATVQKILQKDKKYITEINVKMHDLTQAKVVAPEYAQLFGYKAEDWETANATMLVGEIFRNIITYAVSVTLLIVAGFGIYNILNMTIYNKMRDIAILKATGFTSRDIRNIFMIQSLAIGFVGSLLGIAIGFILAFLISRVPFDAGDVISLTHLPVNFSPTFYLIGVTFGMGTTAVAGYMPSRMAGRVAPIDIIRGQ